MALEHKLAASVKKHHERETKKKEEKGESGKKYVEIHQLNKGFRVHTHDHGKEEMCTGEGCEETAHTSHHSAMREAKEHFNVGTNSPEDEDKGKMEE